MSDRITEIQTLIDKADTAYYTEGKSVMEDARYDKLKAELKTLNPTDARLVSVGSTIKDAILQKKKHTIPMGSLAKAMNEGEWQSWLSNNGFTYQMFNASLKMDGGSFSLEYNDGRLVSAISRGDGFVGEDVTANAINFKNVPKIVKLNGKLFSGFVRGEVVLLNEDWEKVDLTQSSNPRNLAVGIARRKDGTQSEYLSFYSFRAFNLDGDTISDRETLMSESLEKMGFAVAPYISGDKNDVWKFYQDTANKRSKLNFWIDGIVVKIDSINEQLKLGESGGCPKGQIAIKFEAEGAESILRGVTLQVGHTGAIVPVANFDPVRIGGTTITNATLCNWDNIETLGVAIGDKISVIKAGDIIPRIMEVTERGKNRQTISVPKRCPVCNSEEIGYRTNVSGEASAVIYCMNSEKCPAQITGKIDKYLSSLDIQGVGTTLIESLVNDLGVKDPSDLYILSNKRNQMADLILSGKVRLGEKRADKFLAEIEKRRTITLSEFLGSLGIFGLGKRRVALIQEALVGKMDTLEDWFSNTLISNADEAGVKNMAQGIHDELVNQKDYIMKFIKNGLVISQPQPKQQLKAGSFIICITGALSSPKSKYQSLIENSGNGYTDTFSKSITHLVAADKNGSSNKLEKARKYGITIINEDDLLKLISS
jgi:DNA ligase (NAD+)